MKKIILILTMLLSTSLLHAFPKVYPSIIEMNIDKGRSRGEFTIFNSEKEVKKYKLGINKKDNLEKPSEFSKYLKVFPKYIEIEPGENQKIRVLQKVFQKISLMLGKLEQLYQSKRLNHRLRKNTKVRKVAMV